MGKLDNYKSTIGEEAVYLSCQQTHTCAFPMGKVASITMYKRAILLTSDVPAIPVQKESGLFACAKV